METTSEFREAEGSSIKSHVIVELNGWYIDLTLNQFEEYRDRVVIDKETGTLGSLLKKIRQHSGVISERCIQLDTASEKGDNLYNWLRDTADSLMTSR